MSFPLMLSDVMPFGKHKDVQIEDLIYDEPRYMTWLAEETDTDFDIEVTKLMEERKLI